MTSSKTACVNKRACLFSQVHICAMEYQQLIMTVCVLTCPNKIWNIGETGDIHVLTCPNKPWILVLTGVGMRCYIYQLRYYSMNIHKQYGVYFETQISRIISNSKKLRSLYRGLNQGPSNPIADDIPMCYHASLAGVFGVKQLLETSNMYR